MAIDNINKITSATGVPNKSKVATQGTVAEISEVKQPSKSELEAAVKKLNALMAQSNTSVEFSLDKTTGSPVIKVVDTETKSVLRQLPNLEAIAFSRSLETFKGLLLNQKV
ncbi:MULTISPECIES: flagellar protein FlaG [Methylotenera]|uniref:flagellar protein FlaG n=1 Tax=Methylotenera TaxID=359407 RepID=UPI000366830D|nr:MULTISPECIES: flagellar protein FlaG [Methylotenera]